jgi:hypothetical protein
MESEREEHGEEMSEALLSLSSVTDGQAEHTER